MRDLAQHYNGQHIAIIGASGAIGQACIDHLATAGAKLILFSRQNLQLADHVKPAVIKQHLLDLNDEQTLAAAAEHLKTYPPLTGILVTTGLLHGNNYGNNLQPEKSIRQLTAENFLQVLATNTVGPALVARHFLPYLARDQRVWFAALSARVGSISDNRLGGWYAYRAAKAALNMVIKNLSIELARRHKSAVVVGLHPGTVDSNLSKPFQSGVTPEKLFSPSYSAHCLLSVLANLTPADTGLCFDWAGKEIPP